MPGVITFFTVQVTTTNAIYLSRLFSVIGTHFNLPKVRVTGGLSALRESSRRKDPHSLLGEGAATPCSKDRYQQGSGIIGDSSLSVECDAASAVDLYAEERISRTQAPGISAHS